MRRTPTISAEAEELLIKVARDAGYDVLEKLRSDGNRTKVLVLKKDGLPLPVVVHKDSGRSADKLDKLKVATAPSMFNPDLADEVKGISVAVNPRSGTNGFRHSAYRSFVERCDGREPVGHRYEIDWALGGPDAFTALLHGLKFKPIAI